MCGKMNHKLKRGTKERFKMTTLTIRTASGMEFTVSGTNCVYSVENECYYIKGESFPAEIVINIDGEVQND